MESQQPSRPTGPSPTPFDAQEAAQIAGKLSKRLPAECISNRSGVGGKLSYLEGWRAIELANEIFGFNMWSMQVVSQTVDYADFLDGKWSVGIQTVVRISLKDGCYREDVGYGLMENSRSKGQAFEKARKESVTDALKRTLRLFGNALGNCISDKDYLRQIAIMPTAPPRDFQPEDMYWPANQPPSTGTQPSRPANVSNGYGRPASLPPTATNPVNSYAARPGTITNITPAQGIVRPQSMSGNNVNTAPQARPYYPQQPSPSSANQRPPPNAGPNGWTNGPAGNTNNVNNNVKREGDNAGLQNGQTKRLVT
ncbi:DNA repair protein rad52 [Sorochytrium milnesiophthora]